MRKWTFGNFVILACLGLFAPVAAIAVALTVFPDQIRGLLPASTGQLFPPILAAPRARTAAYWLDQNWAAEDRFWFHHATQGTATFPMPYAWFVALEQPAFSFSGDPGLLSDSGYLERMGFIPSPASTPVSPEDLSRAGYPAADSSSQPAVQPSSSVRWDPASNPDRLPVGFTRIAGIKDPVTGTALPDQIGLTCAACHTGHIEYKGVSLRFDGGPAATNIHQLGEAAGLSLVYTAKIPGRFDRFASRVLGPQADATARALLKTQFDTLLSDLIAQSSPSSAAPMTMQATHVATMNAGTMTMGAMMMTSASAPSRAEEGFGRLDALNRIGNTVFDADLERSGYPGAKANFHTPDAPVRYPPIWTVPWFKWAEYDSSIEHPLVRNAGEALGVGALVNLTGATNPEALFRSSVALPNIVWIEDLLRGGDPFTTGSGTSGRPAFSGLSAPKWPAAYFPGDPAWAIDAGRVERGRALYASLCANCHLGPVADPVFDHAYPDQSFWRSPRWQAEPGKTKALTLVEIPVSDIGTDPAQANVLKTRTVDVPPWLNIDPARDIGVKWGCPDVPAATGTRMPFAYALMALVDRVTDKWLDDHAIPAADRAAIFGPRKDCPNPAAAAVYKARPLNGVWAIAPYLHNGSVPSLYWLLSPAAQRPRQFCLGARDYDPRTVGYAAANEGAPACARGETLFAAFTPDGRPIPGNSVLGHSFEGPPGQRQPGVIGRQLNDGERADLIEYLKTL